MRKTIITLLLAATVLPAAAQAQSAPAGQAQSNEELRHDRRDIRQEQRELRDAQRSGDRRDIRDQREDVRDARQEYREDRRDRADDRADDRAGDRNRAWSREDWRGWRDRNPGQYARGTWRAPFRYTAFRPGLRISAGYYGSRYIIADPWRYHLRRPAYGQQWVRHYDDVILVDTRRGVVVDVVRGFYR